MTASVVTHATVRTTTRRSGRHVVLTAMADTVGAVHAILRLLAVTAMRAAYRRWRSR